MELVELTEMIVKELGIFGLTFKEDYYEQA